MEQFPESHDFTLLEHMGGEEYSKDSDRLHNPKEPLLPEYSAPFSLGGELYVT